jgi:hypothetical protein
VLVDAAGIIDPAVTQLPNPQCLQGFRAHGFVSEDRGCLYAHGLGTRRDPTVGRVILPDVPEEEIAAMDDEDAIELLMEVGYERDAALFVLSVLRGEHDRWVM